MTLRRSFRARAQAQGAGSSWVSAQTGANEVALLRAVAGEHLLFFDMRTVVSVLRWESSVLGEIDLRAWFGAEGVDRAVRILVPSSEGPYALRVCEVVGLEAVARENVYPLPAPLTSWGARLHVRGIVREAPALGREAQALGLLLDPLRLARSYVQGVT